MKLCVSPDRRPYKVCVYQWVEGRSRRFLRSTGCGPPFSASAHLLYSSDTTNDPLPTSSFTLLSSLAATYPILMLGFRFSCLWKSL